MAEFIILNSPGCTAIWEVFASEAPLWRYWGPRLPDGTLPPGAYRDSRPEPSFTIQTDVPLALFSAPGLGWFGHPAVQAHRMGKDWAQAITGCRVEQPDAATVLFHLTDDVAQIGAVINARLDPESDVLTLSTTLTNHGADTLDVQWLAAGGVPLPPHAQSVHSLAGRHNSEFTPVTDMLTRSQWRRENRRGLTSHDAFPGAQVHCAGGVVYAAQLGWSGNHTQLIDWVDDGRWHWQMGEALAPGEVRLASGESISTPDMLATVSADGANGTAWNFHRAIRKRMHWPNETMRSRPVHLNTWEAVYFWHDETQLMELASAAAGVGIERFVLDDGWFAGRNNDTSSLGDWTVDAAKYPMGLAPLARHVTSLGMEFGLWVEPEMVNPDSDLYRAHPDWALLIAGRPHITARNQMVLDMANPDVSEYLYTAIAALLRDLPITYLKWDHNRDLTNAGETPRYRQQVLATYALMARLRSDFPQVEIEACAGGGGRIDAGIIRYTHRFWTSDCIDAASRVPMQRAFLNYFPPEVMGSHVGASPAHSTGQMQAMDFRSGVALPGHFGVELDVRTLSDVDRAQLAAAIARYKAHRDQLHSGRVWMGEAGDGLLWQVHGTETDLLLLLTRHQPTTQRHRMHVPLPMVRDDRDYRISANGHPDITINGAWLKSIGFPAPPMQGQQVILYSVKTL